ncbi:MAG: class I SAM-dependent methyltransferase [Bacteroidia bacterium]|nr:class I SAM-dependent methyltransferase [Bacteroidia bacterium]
MDSLTKEQLQTIPWIKNYNRGKELPIEPPIDEIPKLVNIPFMKRNKMYGLFYIWSEIIKLIPKNIKVILDAACGLGQIAQILSLKGYTVYACDIENNFKGDKSINFQITNLNKIFPYQDSFFDVVTISGSLHYLDNQKHFFNEALRILKQGGFLIFSAPNLNCIHSKLLFCRTGKLFDYSINRPSVLYSDFFLQYLNMIGFKLICKTGAVPLKSFKIFAFRLWNLPAPFLKLSKDQVENYSSAIIYKFQKIK